MPCPMRAHCPLSISEARESLTSWTCNAPSPYAQCGPVALVEPVRSDIRSEPPCKLRPCTCRHMQGTAIGGSRRRRRCACRVQQRQQGLIAQHLLTRPPSACMQNAGRLSGASQPAATAGCMHGNMSPVHACCFTLRLRRPSTHQPSSPNVILLLHTARLGRISW